MVMAAFHEIFQVPFFFMCLEDELQWLGPAFDPDFAMSEEELLLGHVFFAPLGLNIVWATISPRTSASLDGPRAQPAYYFGPVPTYEI